MARMATVSHEKMSYLALGFLGGLSLGILVRQLLSGEIQALREEMNKYKVADKWREEGSDEIVLVQNDGQECHKEDPLTRLAATLRKGLPRPDKVGVETKPYVS